MKPRTRLRFSERLQNYTEILDGSRKAMVSLHTSTVLECCRSMEKLWKQKKYKYTKYQTENFDLY